MDLPNIFTQKVSQQVIDRINNLTPETQAKWGKMNVSQVLAHCNVTYEMIYTDKHPKPNFLMKAMLKAMVKNKIVTPTPYNKNSPTAPAFKISNEREFNIEKTRLVDYINETQKLGENAFDGKESLSFGVLNKNEWNNMLYKHLDHHLTQFGV